MLSNNLPPYFLPVEIIRSLAIAFDIKQSNKKLDDDAHNLFLDYRKIDLYIDEVIHYSLSKYLSADIANLISDTVKQSIDFYLKNIVAKTELVGFLRKDSIFLLNVYFSSRAAKLLNDVCKLVKGPDFFYFIKGANQRSVSFIIDWLGKSEPNWNFFVSNLIKEDQDRISAWYRGTDLPSSQSINLLSFKNENNNSNNIIIDWNRVKTLLLIARSIDYFRKYKRGGQVIDVLIKSIDTLDILKFYSKKITEISKCNFREIENIIPLMIELPIKLRRTVKKNTNEKKSLYNKIEIVKNNIINSINYKKHSYWVNWNMGRWHVYSGDIEKACEYYKMAFEECLFYAGHNQKSVINESLVVASIQKRPDKTFLKKLKNSSILFGYDTSSAIQKNEKITSAAKECFEDWEVELWKSQFLKIFPEIGYFEGVKYDEFMSPVNREPDDLKPDYRSLDRVIKVGENKRKMPQLVFFIMTGKISTAIRLIDKGANVNASSESGDTPVLMSLRLLDVTCPESQPLDDTLFYKLSKYSHKPEILNTPTAKKRMLPIFSAIESGRPDIVKKILDMGADPDGRGNTELQTALYYCLQLLIKRKNPERLKKYDEDFFNQTDDPVILDSVRRYNAGISGLTLDDQKKFINSRENDKTYQMFKSCLSQIAFDKFIKKMTLENLRYIASLLLEYGADPDAEQHWPLKGYTSLMFAAEINEEELFIKMLNKKGDPYKFYTDPQSGRKIDCLQIAKSFASIDIERVLRNI